VLAGKWKVSIEDNVLRVEARREDAPTLVQRLVEAQVEVYQVKSQKQTLEEYFLIATEEEALHA
jgi:hypothetical protein